MIEADDERQNLLRRLDRLDARERAILALRFGLEGELPLTLKEVGRRLGVTREWVRKIEIRAVRKLDDGESSGGANDLHAARPRTRDCAPNAVRTVDAQAAPPAQWSVRSSQSAC